VEEFQGGEQVLSRSEDDPGGPVAVKVVERIFVRTGRILHLRVQGQVIRTTPEHPFYVRGQGWRQAAQLQVGDWLSGLGGQWVEVEDLLDTGEYETVYNLQVADYHTYFVGSREWGFSAWAHNTCGYEKMLAMFGKTHEDAYWEFYQQAVKYYAEARARGQSEDGARISLSFWWNRHAPSELRKASAAAKSDLWGWVIRDAESYKPGVPLQRVALPPKPPLDQTRGLARLAQYDPAKYGKGQLRQYAAAKDLATHPKHGPDPSKWLMDCGTGQPGEIYIARDGTWVFVDSEGHAVPYVNGYPDFEAAGLVKDTVIFRNEAGDVVEYAGNRTSDFTYANKHSTVLQGDTDTWHHHESLTKLQLVDEVLHDRFHHRGGVSLKKNMP
jgi:hypothetical protein